MPAFGVADANQVATALTDMGVDASAVSNDLLVSIHNDVADRGHSYILDKS
jgi:hypothetical protein